MNDKNEIPYVQEMYRKGIHLLSIMIPIFYTYIDQRTALLILVPSALLSAAIDLLARHNEKAREILFAVVGKMLREHELKKGLRLNGGTGVLISACLCILIFPKIVMITAFMILIISDIFAALVGRKYGKIKFFNKSLEGSLAFALSAIAVVEAVGLNYFAPWIFFVFGYVAAVVAAVAEAASDHLVVDDNISIPFSAGAVLWIGGLIAEEMNLPYLNLI